MLIRTYRQRGRPIYIRSAGTTISLVPEVGVRERRLGNARGEGGAVLRDVAPVGLYVIDADGVRNLTIRDETSRALAILLAIALIAPVLFWVFTRRGRDERNK